ncbi:MAG: 50S ribosomal protein L25/general stress protein Ctc [Hamadaea sp.]|uniref:Large ribosomal subunit protein bL25 n=1 Tax=Glycomyces artemisiae TaxID=1076443 RepID=A0A850CEK3_9ACTN|nr:50S ribosomal protein L25/general stress protein Ctc [Hamadaea sp.]NUQ90343.1 50S ribosomal protein L25/general stress protein Ctc [Glycomyces artemisiae]NUR49899.1 50S ribosomal protein L25/general stress protein Ctc [Hamadaea sp.]NUT08164.1 50S ribosomal protein L25/general stress protein Ctc [Hamadaea sp.]
MSEVKISAEPRTEFGKGGARRTRRAGKVPAVVYGHGEAPKHIALPAREFAAAIRHGGMTTVFELVGEDGTKTLALPKAIQRDPIRDTFEHVDLVIVKRGEKVTVDVPVHLVGTAAAGTLVVTEHDRVSIVAEALHLPEALEASIDGLEAGSHVTAGDIKLPRGVELATEAETTIAVVSVAPTAEQLEGETAEAAEEAEEAPAAEAEAPAES